MDNKFDKLKEFMSNMKIRHQGLSNIYLLESIDKDGNVVDTKYGMNFITTEGFKNLFQYHTVSFGLSNTVGVYVGTSVGDLSPAYETISDLAFNGLRATNADTSRNHQFPIIYAEGTEPDTGIITLINHLGSVYYPMNIANFADITVPISEYGIGTAWNKLITHAHVYNHNGDKSYINKVPGNELHIHIYTCLSMFESLIMDAWNNGTYTTITTNEIMFQHFHLTRAGIFKRATMSSDYISSKTVDDLTVPGTLRCVSKLGDFTIADSYGDNNGYMDGFYGSAPGLQILDRQYLPVVDGVQQTEMFELLGYQAEGILESANPEECLTANIGLNITKQADWDKNKRPQFTTMMNVTMKTYNFHTELWNGAVSFSNDNDFQYSNTGFETIYALPIYYWANEGTTTGYVFSNLFPENPILKVNHGHTSLYATDKYWDVSTWVPISNFDSIPVGSQSAKYWIADTNSIPITPVRFKHGLEIIDPTTGTKNFRDYHTFGEPDCIVRPSVDNPQYQWIAIGGDLYEFGRYRKFEYDDSVYRIKLFTYGRWLICLSANQTTGKVIRCIDTSTVTNVNVDVNIFNATYTLDFTGDINVLEETYVTETGTGWLCFQGLNNGVRQADIVDLRSSTVLSTLKTDWIYSAAIYNTNYIAYCKSGESLIHIYDITTGLDDGVTIVIPSTGSIVGMIGVTNTLWFSDGTNTWYVDISTNDRIPQQCLTNPFNNSNMRGDKSARIGLSCVSDVIAFYPSYPLTDTGGTYIKTNTKFFNANRPDTIKDLTGFSKNISSNLEGRYVKIRYVGDSLFCIVATSDKNASGTYTSNGYKAFDLGRYLRADVADGLEALHDGNVAMGIYLYGDYVFKNLTKMFPTMNCLPFYITGHTKTITSSNVLKRIMNKTYTLGITTNSIWGTDAVGGNPGGKPPGVPKAITNASGKIISWTYDV